MSDLTVAAVKALHKAKAWLSKEHPGDSEAAAAKKEIEDVFAGLQNAAKDVPALVAHAEILGADLLRLGVDIAAKSLNFGDVVKTGKDAAPVWADLEKTYTDFQEAYSAKKTADDAVVKAQATAPAPSAPSAPEIPSAWEKASAP